MELEDIQKKWLQNLKQVVYNRIFKYYLKKNKSIFIPKFQTPKSRFKKLKKIKTLKKRKKKMVF